MKIYRYHTDLGEAGSLKGVFAVNPVADVRLQGLFGKEIYFGGILGKHSSIKMNFNKNDLELVSDDMDEVFRILKIFGLTINGLGYCVLSGICPLDAF